MENRWTIDITFVEQGDIYFFYKPRKNILKPKRITEISRLYFVLQPDGGHSPRYIVMGNKRMPNFTDDGKTTWGFVQIVGGRGFETSNEPNISTRQKASRPAGEGIYAIITHRDHSHLLYSLELPVRLGPVQDAFNITKEANYIFLERPIENPPKSPEIPFSNFSPIKNVENLNKRGTEILLVGIGSDIGRMGIKAEKDKETIHTADIFSKLKVNMTRHPTGSLILGEWE